MPVADPARVTPALVRALKGAKAVYVVLHCNHADELTPETRDACARLIDAGLPMLAQSVLLKGVNDDAAELFRRLVRVEELDERAHRLLLTALPRSGHRGEALRHYERFVALLEREVGSVPEKATSALHDRLRRAEPV